MDDTKYAWEILTRSDWSTEPAKWHLDLERPDQPFMRTEQEAEKFYGRRVSQYDCRWAVSTYLLDFRIYKDNTKLIKSYLGVE